MSQVIIAFMTVFIITLRLNNICLAPFQTKGKADVLSGMTSVWFLRLTPSTI